MIVSINKTGDKGEPFQLLYLCLKTFNKGAGFVEGRCRFQLCLAQSGTGGTSAGHNGLLHLCMFVYLYMCNNPGSNS